MIPNHTPAAIEHRAPLEAALNPTITLRRDRNLRYEDFRGFIARRAFIAIGNLPIGDRYRALVKAIGEPVLTACMGRPAAGPAAGQKAPTEQLVAMGRLLELEEAGHIVYRY